MQSLDHPLYGMPNTQLKSISDLIFAKSVASTIQRSSHEFGNEPENVLLILYRHSQRTYRFSIDLRGPSTYNITITTVGSPTGGLSTQVE